MKTSYLAVGIASILQFASFAQTTNPVVIFRTNLGDIDVQLLQTLAPKSVQNFLNYMNRGAYNNSVFHRSVSGFIIQGGGFTTGLSGIKEDSPVVNEYGVSNTRGTVAMAKLGSGPNTATNQWFFNLADNSGNLNNQNGGFTVFGRVNSAAGLAVMDKIAAVPVPSGVLPSPFDAMPLQNFRSGTSPTVANYIIVNSINTGEATAPPPPTPVPSITSGGITTASAYGGAAYATGGSYIEIYGTNLAGDTARSWTDADFRNGRAPTSLDNVSVTVNRQPAYISYISNNQINVQVPGGVPIIGTVPVAVTYLGQTSPAVQLAIRPTAPGLLAPPSFKAGGKQFVAALHASGAFVANGIADVPNAPAAPGETIIFYGVGFGGVNPSSIPVGGQIVTAATSLSNPLTFKIGGQDATILYQGLAQGLVGLYQFNVTVPAGLSTGDHPLDVIAGTESIPQILFLPVKTP